MVSMKNIGINTLLLWFLHFIERQILRYSLFIYCLRQVITSTVLGELFFGVFKSKRSKTNLKRISDFADSISILMCDKTLHISMEL